MFYVGNDRSILAEACEALLSDSAFKIFTSVVDHVVTTTKALLQWIKQNHEVASIFERKLVSSVQKCVDAARTATGKMHSDRIWTAYHSLCTSDIYVCDWECIMLKAGIHRPSVISYQYIGDFIIKDLIKSTYPLTEQTTSSVSSDLTYEESNGVQYAVGYVVRSLQKETEKSKKNNKDDMLLCLRQLLKQDDEAEYPSQEWIGTIDRGGLCHVNNDTFELFVALEKGLRKHLSAERMTDFTEEMKKGLQENDNVQFIWYIISADWDSENSWQLLNSIITIWMKIRGFSLAGAWVEKYKKANKKTTQKSKGVRKQLQAS